MIESDPRRYTKVIPETLKCAWLYRPKHVLSMVRQAHCTTWDGSAIDSHVVVVQKPTFFKASIVFFKYWVSNDAQAGTLDSIQVTAFQEKTPACGIVPQYISGARKIKMESSRNPKWIPK